MSEELIDSDKEEIFRIYYYDAEPYNRSVKNPIDGKEQDFSNSKQYYAITNFQRSLAEKQYIAFRKGKLKYQGWKLRDDAFAHTDKTKKELLVKSSDITPDLKQKGVDMRIGLDIAWLSTKRIVDKIILVTADNDFIPAMKFARKEGIHVAIVESDSLTTEMKQHSDELRKSITGLFHM